MATNKKQGTSKSLINSDILVAMGIVIIVGMLIIPIPAIFLDIFMSLNIAFCLGILLTITYLNRGADFSVFPTLLLIMTIFRLAINISSTRLILLQGEAFEGEIIHAFGKFVVQNNYVVGLIIFLILIAVQFIVIIKGSTRVSEVAARFTLDSMPGKQMSIDSDLNAGLITEEQANKRRKELREEVDFYGAMDGASKFVQGDVRVGLIITVINLVGGLVVGTTIHELSLSEAFNIFFILTVGDGLSAQIPSLLLSTATGIIITRAVSDTSLGEDIVRQITLKPKAIIITGGFLLGLATLTGFPKFPLITLGTLILGYGIYLTRSSNQESDEVAQQEKHDAASMASSPEQMVRLIHVEPIEIEIGFNIIPFVDVEQGGDLLERLKLIRKTCALDLGLLVPSIRIRDNIRLRPNDYVFKVRGVEVDKGSLDVKRLLAIPSLEGSKEIEGNDTIEPTFKTKAKWIDASLKEEAEQHGYSVVDPPSIIATHLTETIKRNSSDILGRQEIKQILDSVKENYPVLIEDAMKHVSLGKIQKIFQNLLKERISIRNMVSILEVVADYGERVLSTDLLTEYVRQRLAKQISHDYMDERGHIHVFVLEPAIEIRISDSIEETEHGLISTLDVESMNQVIAKLVQAANEAASLGHICIVLCSSSVRPIIKTLSERTLPNLVSLSYNEVIPQAQIQQLGVVSLD